MCNKCLSFVKAFIESDLDGDIEKLKSYDFTDLVKQRKRDCDRLPVVNAIYCLLYSEHFKIDTCLLRSDMFSRNCGDTLNTYKSSFGNGHTGKKSMMLIETEGNSDIFLMLSNFKKRYHSIGNFMPLPVKTICRVSLNTGRNTAYNDYFDLFLMLIEDFYKLEEAAFLAKYTETNIRKSIKNLVVIIILNRYYFDTFNNYNNFIHTNYLDSFYVSGRSPLFNHNQDQIHFNNIEDIKNYLINVIAIIEERSNTIVEVLKKKLA